MKKTLLFLPAIVTCAFAAQANVNVVATLPDFGSLAREIGGDKVNVSVLAKATEDPHFVDARPSFVVSLRNADVLIDGGAELELGWLPPLLQNARNPKIEVGKPSRVQASQGVRLMNVPANVTREKIAAELGKLPEVTRTEIAGPGFINLTLDPAVWRAALAGIVRAGADYGRSSVGAATTVGSHRIPDQLLVRAAGWLHYCRPI